MASRKPIKEDGAGNAIWLNSADTIKKGGRKVESKPKKKKCKSCNEAFAPFRPLQSCCSIGCAISHGHTQAAKKATKEAAQQRQEVRAAKVKAKTRAQWMKEAQAAFNAFRRTEDGINRGGKCISCGTTNGKQNCGHYRSVGSNPSLRFELLNTWLQCERCNTFLHSNAIEFRIALTKILSKEQLDWLEGEHQPKKYTIDELKEIKAEYTKKAKELI